jgi:hypothetical protein
LSVAGIFSHHPMWRGKSSNTFTILLVLDALPAYFLQPKTYLWNRWVLRPGSREPNFSPGIGGESQMVQHPEEKELKRYCEGRGPTAFLVTIDQHVQECDICYGKVGDIIEELYSIHLEM